MAIPAHFRDELLARTDIVEVISGYVSLRKVGNNFTARCPFHDEKTPSFTVSQNRQFYYCFGCGAKGNVISFLMDYAGMDFVTAIEELAARAGLEVIREGESGRTQDNSKHYALMEKATRYFCEQLRQHPEAKQAISYLKRRGLSARLVEEFELGFAPSGKSHLLRALGQGHTTQRDLLSVGLITEQDQRIRDRFRRRLMFPIRDQRGRAIGFGGRVLDDSLPKYLNSPETPIFHKREVLYGFYQAKCTLKKFDRIYVVEGYTDVLALAEYNIRNAVASLGTAITSEHLRQLFRSCPRLIFCFDGDNAGQSAALRTVELALPFLEKARHIQFMFLPEGEDPDSYVRRQGADRFKNETAYVELTDYLIDTLVRGLDLDTETGKSALINAAKPYLESTKSIVWRELLTQRLRKVTKMEPEEIYRILKTAPKPPNRQQKQSMQIPLTIAVSMLLQNPALGRLIKAPEALEVEQIPGSDFLIELIKFVRRQANTTCAQIIEHWRGSPYEKRLAELALSEELLLEENQLKAKFLDTMNKIQTTATRKKRSILSRGRQLSDMQTKEQLRRLYPGHPVAPDDLLNQDKK